MEIHMHQKLFLVLVFRFPPKRMGTGSVTSVFFELIILSLHTYYLIFCCSDNSLGTKCSCNFSC